MAKRVDRVGAQGGLLVSGPPLAGSGSETKPREASPSPLVQRSLARRREVGAPDGSSVRPAKAMRSSTKRSSGVRPS